MQQILSEFTSEERELLADLLERLFASVDRAVDRSSACRAVTLPDAG